MTTAWKPETVLPFNQVLCEAASGSSCISKTGWLEYPCSCTFVVPFYCWSLTPLFTTKQYCKHSAAMSPMQICFSGGCSLSLFSVFQAWLFVLTNWPILNKSVLKKKQNKTPPTSSNFLTIKKHDHIISLHCIHIPNLDSERGTPAKLGRPGEKGWLGFCCPAGVFAGCGANCRAKQTLRPHFKLLPERCC